MTASRTEVYNPAQVRTMQQYQQQQRRYRLQQQRAEAKKKQHTVQKALKFVERDIQHVLSQSPFLQQSNPGDHIALFHRSEIETGRRIGKGGFSNVYEITAFRLHPHYTRLLTEPQQQLREFYQQQTASGRGRYCIKQLQESLLDDSPRSFECAASDLAVEAAYMSALDHPHILSVRGLPIHGLDSLLEGQHDGYFLILDQLEETLDQSIARWKRTEDMPLMNKAGYALQLAGALQYLHERGILFRDLKPQNLGFSSDGRLQLLDFGLCREMPAVQQSDEVFEMSGVGTRRYMAVEIINTGFYNSKADVYSWSMVFWEMLSLGKPYPTYSVNDHKHFVCQGGERPMLDHQWPLPIQNLLKHSWATNIPERLDMQEVQCLLRTYIECCKLLDETPESPTGVNDTSFLSEFSDGLPSAPRLDDFDNEEGGALSDEHAVMMMNLSVQSSIFEKPSVCTAASTDVSSVGDTYSVAFTPATITPSKSFGRIASY